MNRSANISYENCIPAGAESDSEDYDGDDYYRYWEVSSPPRMQPDAAGGVTNRTASSHEQTTVDRNVKPTSSAPRNFDTTRLIDDFRMAIMNGKLSTVKSMLEEHPSDIQVDTILKTGWTGLMYACSFGYADVTDLLLQQGANSNFDHEGLTPLMAACSSNKNVEENLLKCVTCLMSHGANVNASERHQMTPLMFAVKNDRLKIVKLLLENEAKSDMIDNGGWTALHWSVSAGHIEAVRILLRANANANSVGQSMVEFAHDQGSEPIEELLKEFVFSTNVLENAELSVPSSSSSKSKDDSSSANPKQEFSTFAYGDLEIFLSGLGLNSLIPVFHAHELKYTDVLLLSDEDLTKIGVDKLGWRKSILDGIRMVHCKEWEATSLPNLKSQDFITCPDAVCMMANIGKHLNYIEATVVYLREQIKNHPRILELGQESKDVRALLESTEEASKCNQELSCGLRLLHNHLDQVKTNAEYEPADLIVAKQDGHQSKLRELLGRSTMCLSAVVFIAAVVRLAVSTKMTIKMG